AEPERVRRSTLEIAATWLAAGLDPDRVVFYRQSDIPEIAELTWLLSCVAGKGLLNRAHAYKAAVDRNTDAGTDPDAGISVGLFMYPVLMAADILLFNAHKVPVGRDQVQHIEMARDLAQGFNRVYGAHFVLPAAETEESVATLPGLDGRKMSKSYDNTIPLFAPRESLRKLIAGIVTDSRAPGEAKDTAGSALFQIYQAFASAEESQALRKSFAEGIAWGDAKQLLFERIDGEIAPMRERYDALMAQPAHIELTLRAGAERARAIARPFIAELRQAVGLRRLDSTMTGGEPTKRSSTKPTRKAATEPGFRQYRDADGKFYFKLIGTKGRVLLQSNGFADAKDAGRAIARLRSEGVAALDSLATELQQVAGVDRQDVLSALQTMVGTNR
ncbi:MAG: tryptophan--tRNA ligase, partial [Caldimonas sp.]